MLQQPSEFIMYQKLPLDLNIHSPEVTNLQPDFKDIGLQLQAQRAVATQAFFFDAYSVKAVVPSAAPPTGTGIQGMYDLPIQAMYSHPIQAMYDPIRHHHQQHHLQQQQQHYHQQQQQQQQHQHQHQHQQQQQQQQHHHQLQHPSLMPTSGMVSTGSWQHQQQQESRGSWFPNWQEVFHGFVVGKDGQQEKQSMAPSFEQKPLLHQGVIVAPPVAASRATINVGETQPCAPSNSAQTLDPCTLSPPRSHRAATLLPYAAPDVGKKRDDSVIIAPPIATTVAMVSDAGAWQPCLDSDGAQLIDPSPPVPSCSHSATALLPYPAPEREMGRESSLVPCRDLKDPQSPPPVDAIACRYTTQSPSWLPQGWITEVQTRRSGSTAGTRDKYYKDLVSGRRFRSRNEVIHFLQTGKGRLRKRRRKKAIASSAFGGPHNLLSHQPHSLTQDATASPCLFLAPQPLGFLLGPLVNSHPVHTTPNVPSVSGSAAEEVEAPCQTPVAHPTTSSMPAVMLGLKQPIDVRPQKLPVQRKAKTLSPKKCEDKQASRLWQWLQKPVARTTEQPQRQDADMQVNNDGKNAEDSVREPGIARRTAQLGKEIEVAQKTVKHLGKQMQETVEKLTREIQTAQRDLRLEMQATHGSDDAMSNVIQAAHRLDSAMGNVTQATQNLVIAMGIAVRAAQLSDSKVGAASPAKQPQRAVANVIQEVPRPDMAMTHSAPRGYTAQAVERPDLAIGYFTHAAKQPQVAVPSAVQEAPWSDVAMTHSATGGCTTQAHKRPDLAMGYFMEAHRMPNGIMGSATEAVQRPDLARGHIAQPKGVMGYATEVAQRPDLARGHITQPVQMLDVTMHYTIQGAQMPQVAMYNPATAPKSPHVVMSSAWTQATQRIDVATGIGDVPDASPLNMGELSRDMHAYQKAVELSKQIVEARSRHITNKKFAALNPKLDLSMLSASLSSRQRAKVVQKMKAKHARGLLVVLGRKLCLKALRKAAETML